jgi:outer membrane protein assembly factor BamB
VFLFAEGTLVKFDSAGEPLWKRNIVGEYGPLTLDFGFSSSPLLHAGKLYIPVLRRTRERRSEPTAVELESYLLCVDAASGQTLFKCARPTDAVEESTNAYTTPIAAIFNGRPQIILYGGDYLTGHEPDTGRELWRYLYARPRGRLDRLIPTPAADGERIYCAYPRGTGTFAVKPAPEPNQVWAHDEPGPDVSSPALYEGHLYLINEKQKTLTCLAAESGQVQWVGQLDKSAMYYASITAADEKLYMVNREGVVTVAAADPKAFGILSTGDIGERPADSTMAVAEGRVFLRTAENLYCFGNANE